MNTFRVSVTVVAAALATAGIAGAAAAAGNTAAKKIPFTAKYAGKAVVKVTDNVADISATGPGTASLIGRGRVSGKGKADSSVRPCVPFTGLGTMTGAGGKLTFKVVSPPSTGCGDESGEVFSLSGRVTVVKGTGKLARAKGSLKLTGVYDRSKGTFSVKFTGTLTR
jgi:hypothetical protein